MRRTSTTLDNEDKEEKLNVRRESSLSPATKKESQLKVLKSQRNSIYKVAKKLGDYKRNMKKVTSILYDWEQIWFVGKN